MFTKKLNEPTVRSKPVSSLAKVSWNSGECGSKSIAGSDVLFVDEAVCSPFVEWLDEPLCVAWFGEFWSLDFVGELSFADVIGELLPLDEAAETVLPAAIVPTDGAN